MATDTSPLTPKREKEISETIVISNTYEEMTEETFSKNFTSFLDENKDLIDRTLNVLDKGSGR